MLEISNISKHFRRQKGLFFVYPREDSGDLIKAVDDVSLLVKKAESIGLVGESGSGKTTIGKLILRLLKPNSGKIYYKEEDIYSIEEKEFRKSVQMIFQNPDSTFNTMMKVNKIMEEAISIGNKNLSHLEVNEKMEALFEMVGIEEKNLEDRYPFELGGGQKRMLGIARTLAVDTEFIIADEPIAGVDVPTQIQIIDLFQRLKEEKSLTYLFISHDLDMIKNVCDKIAVMYRGKIVELGETRDVIDNPSHPYTRDLLNDKAFLAYNDLQNGACNFYNQCDRHKEKCKREEPSVIDPENLMHKCACHYPVED